MTNSNRQVTGLVGVILICGVVGYVCYSLFRIITTFAPDFSVYYGATQELLSGSDPYRSAQLFTGFGYPPFTALAYIPFLLFPYRFSQALFVLVSFLCVPLSVYLFLAVFLEKRPSFLIVGIWTAIALLLFPTRFTLGMGQSNLIVLALIACSLYAHKTKRDIVGGVFWAAAAIFKPHLLILLPFFIASGLYSFSFVSCVVIVFSILFSGVLFGWERFIQYYKEMVVILMPFRGREIYYNQGFAGFFARLLPEYVGSLVTGIASIIAYACMIFASFRKRLELSAITAVGLGVMVLVEPLSWQHHGVFYIPLFIYIWKTYIHSLRVSALLVISAILIGYNIKDPSAISGFLRPLLLSHGSIGAILIVGLGIGTLWKSNL